MASKSYIQSNFDRLVLSDEWKSKIAINGGEGGHTNWLSITNEQLEQIKQILLQGASDEQS